jgi:GNAT superfamily N-acetyltransferase
MITPKMIVDENPNPRERDSILGPLLAYNEGKVGEPNLVPFAILLRDPGTDTTIGGLWAQSAYGWFFVDLLFVPEAMRRSGIGSQLMRRAEAAAVQRRCVGVFLDSFSFQARGFYEKLEYEIFGTLDYPRGVTRYFFRKLMSATSNG